MLTTLALTSYKKIPGLGPRAIKVSKACVTALGMMPGMDAVGQSALLRVKVKLGTTQKEKASKTPVRGKLFRAAISDDSPLHLLRVHLEAWGPGNSTASGTIGETA